MEWIMRRLGFAKIARCRRTETDGRLQWAFRSNTDSASGFILTSIFSNALRLPVVPSAV